VTNTIINATTDAFKSSNCLQYGLSKLSTPTSPAYECQKCECGYTLDLTTTPLKCKTSTIPHCNKSMMTGTKETCSECRWGSVYYLPQEDYGLASDGSSCLSNLATGNTPKCFKYAAGTTPTCAQCQLGYILNNDSTVTTDKICLPIPSTQLTYSTSCLKAAISPLDATKLVCKVCADSTYKLNQAGTDCSQATIANCLTQSASDRCDACIDSTYFQPTD